MEPSHFTLKALKWVQQLEQMRGRVLQTVKDSQQHFIFQFSIHQHILFMCHCNMINTFCFLFVALLTPHFIQAYFYKALTLLK